MHDHSYDEAPPVAICRVGGHQHPGTGNLCDRHLDRARRELADVARMTRELPGRLVPDGSASTGDKVTTSRIGSPTAGRLDVLNLLAAGGREIRRDARMLAPQIRRWSTLSTYEVTVPGPDGKPRTETRTLRTWHAEPVTVGAAGPVSCNCGQQHLDRDGKPVKTARPLLVMDDDQVGSIPPAEWLDMWVRRWRLALRHTTSPIKGRVDLACDADQRRRLERVKMAEAMRAARGVPALMPAVAHLAAVHAAYTDHLQRAVPRVRMALLGVRDDGPEHQARVAAATGAGRLPDAADLTGAALNPVHDPIAAEWAVRYGYAGVAAAVEVDARYLAEWLPLAADHDDPDHDVDVATFATELRALHTELEHVLGYTSDTIRIGRCPAYLRDTDGEDTDRLCGAVIRQDPYRSVVECPRCHTSWPEREWMHLANLIRVRWPIDPHRRYTQGDKVAAEKAVRERADSSTRAYRCRGCERVMTVDWVETTGRRDLTRTWSPKGLACPGGCIAGGVTAAA